jgi:hypothetical protein
MVMLKLEQHPDCRTDVVTLTEAWLRRDPRKNFDRELDDIYTRIIEVVCGGAFGVHHVVIDTAGIDPTQCDKLFRELMWFEINSHVSTLILCNVHEHLHSLLWLTGLDSCFRQSKNAKTALALARRLEKKRRQRAAAYAAQQPA